MTENQDPALLQEDVGDDVDTTADPQAEEEAAESSEESEEGAGAGDDTPQNDEDGEAESEPEIDISIKDEAPPPAPKDSSAWARMRRENAELKRQLQSQGQAQPEAVADPGPKPTWEACGFNEEEHDRQVELWKQAKQRHEAQKQSAVQQAEEADRFWRSRRELYDAGAKELAAVAPNRFAAAQATVSAALSKIQQNVLLKVADNPAEVVYALGRYPNKLEEISKETDVIRLGAKLAKLEANLTKPEKPKSNVPPPEQKVRGSGPASGGKDATLERLRAQADKTGNRTPVVEYLRKKREAKR